MAGRDGTIDASLDWVDPSVTSIGTENGSIPASGEASGSLAVDGESHISAQLVWSPALHTREVSWSPSVEGGSSATDVITTDEAGPITAAVSWPATTRSYQQAGNVGFMESADHPITVSANGTISATLAWNSQLRNQDLELLDDSGQVVASSTAIGHEYRDDRLRGHGARHPPVVA